ncbi:benzoate carboxyl methyltransferase-like protein [Tanacetum coccineum]
MPTMCPLDHGYRQVERAIKDKIRALNYKAIQLPAEQSQSVLAMVVTSILHMKNGNGEFSYALNSYLQETGIRKTLHILEHTIRGIAYHDVVSSQCFKIADLGCSSSKNTLLVVSSIIDIVTEICKENSCKPPQFQVCLNDLFENDFNNLFKMLPDFYATLKKEKEETMGHCFVSAVPGSFYARLFPDQSMHFVHSSYSLQWLSQVPKGIGNNTSNIYIAKTSPPNVIKAYAKQFYEDFTKFLLMRSKEIVRGGCMVLTIVGRSIVDPTSDDCCSFWELLAQALLDLVKEGLVRESDINSFNIPIYTPCKEELRSVIHNEGSFSLDNLNIFKLNWDPNDKDYTSTYDLDELSQGHGINTAKMMRGITEPLLTSNFGDFIIQSNKIFSMSGGSNDVCADADGFKDTQVLERANIEP